MPDNGVGNEQNAQMQKNLSTHADNIQIQEHDRAIKAVPEYKPSKVRNIIAGDYNFKTYGINDYVTLKQCKRIKRDESFKIKKQKNEKTAHEITHEYNEINAIMDSSPQLRLLAGKSGVEVRKDIPEEEQQHNEVRKMKLHSNVGTRYAVDGDNVLEFDMAGSGYKQPPKLYKHLSGESTYIEDIVKENSKTHSFKMKKESYGLLNKLFGGMNFLGLFHIKSKREIDEANAIYNKMNIEIERAYGKRVKINHRDLKHVRMKTETNSLDATKTKFSFAGPIGLDTSKTAGALNTGDYKIENLRHYMGICGKKWLKEKLNTIETQLRENGSIDDVKPIHILISGHSRGGVAASTGAMKLNQWIYSHYSEAVAKKVVFELRINDPVPGEDVRRLGFQKGGEKDHVILKRIGMGSGVFDKHGRELSLHDAERDKHRFKWFKKGKYRSLNENAKTTVVYSFQTEYKNFFTPQRLTGVDRLIFTPFEHNVNVNAKMDENIDGQDKFHRHAYTDWKTNQAYRSLGINELGRGCYVVNESNQLIKLENAEQLNTIFDKFLEGSNAQRQVGRINRLKDAAREWFLLNR